MSRHWQRPATRLIGRNTSGKRIERWCLRAATRGRKRLGKKEGGDLVERQLAVLNGVQEFRVGPAAGAERLHRQRVATALPQVVEEQSGQEGFADAGVGAGDEDDAGEASWVHGGELTTEPAGWTGAN